jgi:uncharacterized protein (DUF58 family)
MASAPTPGRLQTGVMRWALRRQGPDRLPLKLASRRVYILPTRTGWTFGLLLVAMFIAGMNYSNGLALLLTFWLASFALVAMIQTQRGLAGLSVLRAAAEPAFAGGRILVTLEVDSPLAAADLDFSCPDQAVDRVPPTQGGASQVQIEFTARSRGVWQVPVLRLESSAPFGLFRTWTWLALDLRTLVYPRPQGDPRLPEVPGADQGERRLAGSLDELAGLRPFREGDSPRQVAWKAYARGAPLLVREYQGHVASAREFDFSALAPRDTEARLSQLARWVVDAAAQNQGWTLRLPGLSALSGGGSAHRRTCLEQLALYAPESAA